MERERVCACTTLLNIITKRYLLLPQKRNKMTLKEAVLKSLEDINEIANYSTVLNHILAKGYYDFGDSRTPGSTISAVLGSFIRNGDARVKRIKEESGYYSYYLTKNEHKIAIEILSGDTATHRGKPVKLNKVKSYQERDLHKLLSSYLKNSSTYSKKNFTNNLAGKTITKYGHTQIWLV